MSKIIKIIALVLVLCCAVFVLTACNKTTTNDSTEEVDTTVANTATTEGTGESTTSASAGDNALVGSWENKSYGSSYTYTFNADGTGKYDAAGTIMEFTYTTSGNKISILYTGNTDPFETEYNIDGNTLNVIDSLGNDTLYEKV